MVVSPAGQARRWLGYARDLRHRAPTPVTDWPRYLSDFHRRRPGITEDVLAASASPVIGDPYDWVAAAVSAGPVLDLACGSGPMWGRAPAARPWVGVDRSASELARGRGRGVDGVIRADATHLPFPEGTFATVVCSMALMILQPLESALAELTRVLMPGGVVVLLLPGRRPLGPRDLRRYARIMVAVRRSHLTYPNGRALRRLADRVGAHGLEIVVDGRRRFAFPLTDLPATRRFVDSLYLPGVPPDRIRAAKTLAAPWEGSDIGIPLRRVVLRRVTPDR
jgi:SAM-dependent methyltransferase